MLPLPRLPSCGGCPLRRSPSASARLAGSRNGCLSSARTCSSSAPPAPADRSAGLLGCDRRRRRPGCGAEDGRPCFWLERILQKVLDTTRSYGMPHAVCSQALPMRIMHPGLCRIGPMRPMSPMGAHAPTPHASCLPYETHYPHLSPSHFPCRVRQNFMVSRLGQRSCIFIIRLLTSPPGRKAF